MENFLDPTSVDNLVSYEKKISPNHAYQNNLFHRKSNHSLNAISNYRFNHAVECIASIVIYNFFSNSGQ